MEQENQTPQEPVVEPKADEVVPVKAYEEVKNDMLKFKQQLRTIEKEKEELSKRAKELELAGLRAKEDYKAMYEDAEKRAADADAKFKQSQRAIIDDKKLFAMRSELQRLGMIDQALGDVERMIDLEDVEVEFTSSGRVNVLNAKDLAERFKAQRPFLFQQASGPKVNTQTPGVISPSTVSMDMVKQLEAKWKKERTAVAEADYKKALLALKGVQ